MCVHASHLWKQLLWPHSPLPHPVPAVSQQLTMTYCPPSIHLRLPHPSTSPVLYSKPPNFLAAHTDSVLSLLMLSVSLLYSILVFNCLSCLTHCISPFHVCMAFILNITCVVPALKLSWSHLLWLPLSLSHLTFVSFISLFISILLSLSPSA